MDNKTLISYNGQTMETVHYKEITNEKFNELKNDYYTRPSKELVKKEFINISKGGIKNSNITNYYVKDLMAKTLIYYNKWSIEDVFNHKPLLEHFYSKIYSNDKVYCNNTEIKNIETAFRLGGKGTASKPANFPIKTVDKIIEKYNVNNNYYDFSCGWGSRLTSALKNNVNYFGTDPNYLLAERLRCLSQNYKSTIKQNTSNIDIRDCGSEEFQADWKNKIGLAFSSPPYFYLEDYKIGKQSYKDGTSYNDWLNDYLKSTFINIYEYLIQEGYFLININNFKNFNLVDDTIKLAQECGFILVGEHKLENIKRINSKGNGVVNDNSEKILVFTK